MASPTLSHRDSPNRSSDRSQRRSPSPLNVARSRTPRRSISPQRASRSRSPSRPRSRREVNQNGWRSPRRPRSRSYSRTPERNLQQTSKIVVEKLTKNISKDHLEEIFGEYGSIKEVDLPMNREFMTNRGTAYIMFEDLAGAEAAAAHMHEGQIDGAVIDVSIVLPKRKFSRSPPPSRRLNSFLESREPRAPPPSYRPPPPASNRYRSPPPRYSRSPPPRGYPPPPPRNRRDDSDTWRRGRSYSRSRSPRRSYTPSRSISRSRSRSRSRTPPRRRGDYGRRYSPPKGGRRRRSPSYSSYYDSYSDRSRSRSRDRRRR